MTSIRLTKSGTSVPLRTAVSPSLLLKLLFDAVFAQSDRVNSRAPSLTDR
jgi:hypothetical protein